MIVCPKCRNKNILNPKYVKEYILSDPTSICKEYLEYTCGNCGYKTKGPTADSEEAMK